MHATVTTDAIVAAIQEDDNLGFCTACGEEAYCVEPDARKYECESCGERAVYGALMRAVPLVKGGSARGDREVVRAAALLLLALMGGALSLLVEAWLW